jgi:Tripartite ATP-independent periplasmic transporter, DctM component
VLLGVNMQTSFMHPPFGFALFYLRSVAPIQEYTDKLTKAIIKPVTTMQIYWGAVPFVVIQMIMVGLIIAFPAIVSSGLDKNVKVDLDKVKIEMPMDDRGNDAKERTNEELFKLPPAPGSTDIPAPGAAPSAPAGAQPAPADDPMKAILDAVKKDEAKKP